MDAAEYDLPLEAAERTAQELCCGRPVLACLKCGAKAVLLPPTINSSAVCLHCGTEAAPPMWPYRA